jgi:hypothetical protein
LLPHAITKAHAFNTADVLYFCDTLQHIHACPLQLNQAALAATAGSPCCCSPLAAALSIPQLPACALPHFSTLSRCAVPYIAAAA